MTDFQRKVFCIAGLPFDALTEAEAVARLREAVLERESLFFSTPNLNFLISAQTDAEFRDSVLRSDLSLADGMPVIWLARLLRLPIPERVAGASVFESLRKVSGPPLRVCFFGGPAGAAAKASARLNDKPGGLIGVGGISPGYGSIDEMSTESTIARINACQPDFVVVALGARKGQAWIERNRRRLNAPLISHLGAVVNFTAGLFSRAPRWMQLSGLEWAWRIGQEPSLWRRYWRDGRVFLKMLCWHGLLLLFGARMPSSGAEPVLHSQTDDTVCRINLQGNWTNERSGPMREVFQQVAAADLPVQIDLSRVTWLDSACIALLMLLFGHQHSKSLGFCVVGVSPLARRQLQQHSAHYLLE